MPVYELDEEGDFPNPELADPDDIYDGLIAIGGDLSVGRLLSAYLKGIFPWYSMHGVPFWFSPDPRCILKFDKLHISRSMQKIMKRDEFKITFDTCFEKVITQCAAVPRNHDNDTWITEDFISAYCNLYDYGYAHSVEVWLHDELIGGMYGVSLGSCFFGESMFSRISNASKYAFINLAQTLKQNNFTLFDCQVSNPHLETLGAQNISRKHYLNELNAGLKNKTLIGKWTDVFAH